MMMDDMHVHSIWSDGSMPPEDIVRLAAKLGLRRLALTDHDTTMGYCDMLQAGLQAGIEVVSGIEVSAWNKKEARRIHLLGYHIQHLQMIEDALAFIRRSRHQAQLTAIAVIQDAGFPISEKEVMTYAGPGQIFYRSHIMHALMDRGYTTSIFGPLYEKFFTRGGPARFNAEYIDMRDAIALIHQAGGKAVLAHPIPYGSLPALPDLTDAGLDGIEVYYPRHTEDDMRQLLALAQQYHLEPFKGSDFHGMYRKTIHPLGTVLPDFLHDLKSPSDGPA